MNTNARLIVKDRAISILASLVIGSLAESQVSCIHTNDAEYCHKEKANPDLSLQHCSRGIQSGALQGQALATVFNNRGNAYADKGEYDRAIQDYNQAIHLNSTYAIAFDN